MLELSLECQKVPDLGGMCPGQREQKLLEEDRFGPQKEGQGVLKIERGETMV